jgi:6,7-dimethyl-8-ribityllumazine synthase
MKNIAIVLGEFHKKEMEIMLQKAREVSLENELNISEIVWVPGSLEKPIMIKKLLQKSEIDGVVVLGIIEKGGTKHGLVMGQVVTEAIVNLQLEFMKPIGMGILGPEIEPDQISPRLEPYAEKAVRALSVMLERM